MHGEGPGSDGYAARRFGRDGRARQNRAGSEGADKYVQSRA